MRTMIKAMRAVCLCALAAVFGPPAGFAADGRAPAGKLLKVGVYADDGSDGIGAIEWFRLVNDSPEMELKLLDGEAVRAGRLDGLDLLVMPGGDSKRQFTSLGQEGVARMKEFVKNGGGYIGTCGGCYLMLDRTGGSHKRAHMIPWDKSGSEHSLLFPTFRLNEKGAAALGLKPGTFTMRYHGGPFLYPCTNFIAEAHVESWGTFEAEACMTGRVDPKKRMYGATAIIGGTYGNGRVFGISGHPEYFDSTLYVVKGAFRYVTGREVTFPARLHAPHAISVGFLANGISGVETAETALALAAEKDFDLVPIDKDGIFQRRLDGIDVLVVASDRANQNEQLSAAIKEFAARGGKIVGFGTGRDVLPERGIACGSRMETVLAIKWLFAAEPAKPSHPVIAPDDGVPPKWEKPQTTRRYLHGPLSERLLTFWREGKLIFAENRHQPDWRLPYNKQAAHGAWLVRGDGTAFDFKTARLNVTSGGEPDHSQTWSDAGVEVTLSACAPFGRKPSIFARAAFSNEYETTVVREFIVLLRSAMEADLVHSGPDVYAIYQADVGKWMKIASTDWLRTGDVFRSGDRFVAFKPCKGVSLSWDGERGGVKMAVRLKPGETRSIDFTLGRGEEPSACYDAARRAMKASWDTELSALVLPESTKRDVARRILVRHLAVQLLQCIAMPAENGVDCVLPRQGGLQRLVWPGESVHVVAALDLLGLTGYADAICDFYGTHCVQESGEAGPFRNNWAGDTAYVLGMISRHCVATRNFALWHRHAAKAAKSFGWIKAKREADGLFPPMKSTDSASGLQHWGHTDLVNVDALDRYAAACEVFAEPNAAAARAEWMDYRKAVEKVLQRWREASKGKDELFIPITASGEREEELVSQGFFYLHPAGFAGMGLLSADELVRLRRNLLRRGFANENGLYMRHPSPRPEFGRHIWYTTWCEMQWMEAWLRVGRRDLAEQALAATLRFSVSPEYIVGERYHDVNPWYFPWSPNASGSGRIVKMLFAVESLKGGKP